MVNKVILIGNAGADPEVRSLESGVKLARLKLATTERIYNSATGERRDHTEWHTITLWRSQADFAERYIRKGTQVYVEGKIRTREFTDEATGARRTLVEIHAEDIKTLGRRSDNEQNRTHNENFQRASSASQPAEPVRSEIDPETEPDNLPF